MLASSVMWWESGAEEICELWFQKRDRRCLKRSPDLLKWISRQRLLLPLIWTTTTTWDEGVPYPRCRIDPTVKYLIWLLILEVIPAPFSSVSPSISINFSVDWEKWVYMRPTLFGKFRFICCIWISIWLHYARKAPIFTVKFLLLPYLIMFLVIKSSSFSEN